MHPSETLSQPFFARFLESQKISGSNCSQGLTDPWPVPIPTVPQKDVEHTLKYPSDGDEV